MHPAFYWWYKHARAGGAREGWGPRAGCGGGPHGLDDVRFGGHDEGFGGGGGGPFGVRRPLRFLAHKLDLSEPQITELARILDQLKIERAQADVDQRRTIASFADAVESATFGEDQAKEG